jgi:hypothetical protein
VLGIALAVTALAIVGKVAGGALGSGVSQARRPLVGVGGPRGEWDSWRRVSERDRRVSNDMFAVVVFMNIATTLVAPPALAALWKGSWAQTAGRRTRAYADTVSGALYGTGATRRRSTIRSRFRRLLESRLLGHTGQNATIYAVFILVVETRTPLSMPPCSSRLPSSHRFYSASRPGISWTTRPKRRPHPRVPGAGSDLPDSAGN